MALNAPAGRAPDRDATPTEFGTWWLSVAEDEYEARRFDQAQAAALIASGHFQRALAEPPAIELRSVDHEIEHLRADLAEAAPSRRIGGRDVPA